MIKSLVLLVCVLSVTSCSSLQRLTNSSGRTPEEQSAYEDQLVQNYRARRQLEIATLRVGVSAEEFESVFGGCDAVSVSETATVCNYRVDYKPMIVTFKDGKLSSYQVDSSTLRAEQAKPVTTRCVRGFLGSVDCTTR